MLRFTVPDMVCGACAKGVVRAIAKLDARARVETDPAAREVRVETAAAGEAALLAALAEAGFPAERKAGPAA